ncbi:MAG: hypothetical protein PHV13_05025 [Candidatus ainarchaeum sp.]|nr:hypothetical protein [Candidatus ainarchaeum sp.]
MKLAHHFTRERQGYETPAARRIKFFARNWYYKKMGEDPAIGHGVAELLKRADREARNAERACPAGNGNFRHFLLAFDGQAQLEQRLRLMNEILFQIQKAARDSVSFRIVASWLVPFSVDVARVAPEELHLRHAVVRFDTHTEKQWAVPPCPGFPLDSELMPNYPLVPSEREIKVCTNISISLSRPDNARA